MSERSQKLLIGIKNTKIRFPEQILQSVIGTYT